MTSAQKLSFEEISQLNERKLEIKSKHVEYLEAHPELNHLLSDFMSAVLLDKPKNIFDFARTHFYAMDISRGPRPLVVCGPSGVGKGTLIKMLLDEFPNAFGFSVSHTTRGPRPGEEDGVHYHFSDRKTMEEEIAAGKFVESADVHTNLYGTSIASVESVRSTGRVCILDIDVQGAKNVKESSLDPCLLFIAPPSNIDLERRLRDRGTESEEKILTRLANSAKEIEYGITEGNFHEVLVNGDLDAAYQSLRQLMMKWYPNLEGLAGAEVETKE